MSAIIRTSTPGAYPHPSPPHKWEGIREVRWIDLFPHRRTAPSPLVGEGWVGGKRLGADHLVRGEA